MENRVLHIEDSMKNICNYESSLLLFNAAGKNESLESW